MEINDIKEEIDAINKKFNSNILMYENFDIKEKIEVISTGSIGLDWKTVCGGIPRARVTEIIGPESSSKCLSGETYINSDQGILTIKELFLLNNVIPSCTNKIINKNINLQNRYNKLEKSIYFVCNNRQKVKTIETKSGFKITGTYNHPLLIMDKDGFIIWKNIKELNIGDYLISPRQTISGNLNFDFQTMYSLGILIADGRFEKNRISITNNDEDIKNFIEIFLSLFLKINYKKYNNNENGSFNYYFNNKEKVTDFYNKFQYSIGKSKDKNVSIIIRQCNIESLKYFIQGYFDCKSSVNYSKVVITVTSASYILLYQIKLILQQLGIISILRKKFVKKYPNNNYYSLEICGQETIKFINIVGTYSTKIRNRYNKILNKKRKESTNIDSIPYLNNIIYTLLKNSNTTRKDWNLFGDIILNKKLKCTYNRLKNILSRKNVFENKHLVN